MKSKNEEVCYGAHAVKTLIQYAPAQINKVYFQEDKAKELLKEYKAIHGDLVFEYELASKASLDKRSQTSVHQGVLAVCKPHHYYHENDLSELLANSTEAPLVLVLDGIQDPHNFGACLRTAEASGVTCVIIAKDQAVGLTPVVHKSSCGASMLVPIVRVTNLVRAMEKLKSLGLWIVGTSLEGTTSIYGHDFKGPTAIVLGNEGQGIRKHTAAHCDYLATIPMKGKIESLNISVANAVCLYEVLRQRLAATDVNVKF